MGKGNPEKFDELISRLRREERLLGWTKLCNILLITLEKFLNVETQSDIWFTV